MIKFIDRSVRKQVSFINHPAILEKYLFDMSTPSNLERAREIARKTGLSSRFESADANWSTDAESKIAEMPRLHIWHTGPGFTAGTYRGRYFVFAIAVRGALLLTCIDMQK